MLVQISRIWSIRTFFFLLSSGLILSSCVAKEENVLIEDIKKEIIALEKMALDQWADGNTSGLALNFAEDATYFDDIAAQHGLEGIDNLKPYFASLSGKVLKHTYELVNPKVQVYGDIAILSTGYKASMDGQLLPPWKVTSVYRLKGDTWKVVHANWSLLKQEEQKEQEETN